MCDISENKIRERAFQIWQLEGCPEGRADVHWQQACRELAAGHRAVAIADKAGLPAVLENRHHQKPIPQLEKKAMGPKGNPRSAVSAKAEPPSAAPPRKSRGR